MTFEEFYIVLYLCVIIMISLGVFIYAQYKMYLIEKEWNKLIKKSY